MVNPVDLIARSRRRIARLAAVEAGLYAVLPLIVTIAIAGTIDAIGAVAWERWGYTIEASRVAILRGGAIALALAELAAVAFFAWRAWRAANGFVAAAERIDDLVAGHQEVVTLATLADPGKPIAPAERSPLFPVLWRRVIGYLEQFDPSSRFRLEPAQPLARSSLIAAGVVVLLASAAIAVMRPMTAEQVLTRSLRQFANSLSDSPAGSDRELAAAARDVASDLENPKLPPEQKQAELQALKQEITKFEDQKRSGAGSGNSGGSSGSGKGSGSGEGKGQGSGKGSGSGVGQGGAGGKGDKTNNQMVELRNDISKAQAQMETETGEGKKSQVAQQKGEKGTGLTPKEGENPNQAGPQSKPNGAGNIELPKPGNLAQGQTPAGGKPSGRKDDKGTAGDTHLGEFPKAANYERFYKLGEKGEPIDIRDARYVVFRMPTAVAAAGGEGRTVADNSRPSAATPYTNVPLKEERLPVSPDEQQLVPPRYRDLIR